VSRARRLFFALWPDQGERLALQAGFAASVAAAGGRAVPAEHLHVTLEFLGAVPDARLKELSGFGAALAFADEPLMFDHLDWWRRSAALVAAPNAAPAGLAALQAELRRVLSGGGFRVDSRPFRPHVTLARDVTKPPPASTSHVAWRTRVLALVESEPTPHGSRYTPLARWPARA
jgi:2'-5' RNA ligase